MSGQIRVRPRAVTDDGFTLVELLVAAALLVVVLLATLTVLDDSQRVARRDGERALAIREAQRGLDTMVRELRHATAVTVASPQVLEVDVRRRGQARTVRYDCSVAHPERAGRRRCVRIAPGSQGDVLVEAIADDPSGSPDVFSFTPAAGPPRYVGIRLNVALDGGRAGGYRRPFVIADGTALRNVQ